MELLFLAVLKLLELVPQVVPVLLEQKPALVLAMMMELSRQMCPALLAALWLLFLRPLLFLLLLLSLPQVFLLFWLVFLPLWLLFLLMPLLWLPLLLLLLLVLLWLRAPSRPFHLYLLLLLLSLTAAAAVAVAVAVAAMSSLLHLRWQPSWRFCGAKPNVHSVASSHTATLFFVFLSGWDLGFLIAGEREKSVWWRSPQKHEACDRGMEEALYNVCLLACGVKSEERRRAG